MDYGAGSLRVGELRRTMPRDAPAFTLRSERVTSHAEILAFLLCGTDDGAVAVFCFHATAIVRVSQAPPPGVDEATALEARGRVARGDGKGLGLTLGRARVDQGRRREGECDAQAGDAA